MIGRLRDGYGITEAQAELRTLSASFRELLPWARFLPADRVYGADFEVRLLSDDIVGQARPVLLLLLAAIGAVLLVVCVNVANLLLARGAARERELATRAALGAGRRRLVRQLLVENVTLALVAGALGALASFATLQLVVALLPADLPRLPEIRVDLRVLAFALGASLATGVVSACCRRCARRVRARRSSRAVRVPRRSTAARAGSRAA